MIRTAVDSYGYSEDDILTDVISSFSTLGCALGEITGPIFAGTLSHFIGIQSCCAVAALCNLVFAILFILITGYATDTLNPKLKPKGSLLMRSLVSPSE